MRHERSPLLRRIRSGEIAQMTIEIQRGLRQSTAMTTRFLQRRRSNTSGKAGFVHPIAIRSFHAERFHKLR